MPISNNLFSQGPLLIGMVHVLALPGSPKATLSMSQIIENAISETKTLVEAGFHSIMIENMHDRPYLKKPQDPILAAAMSVIGQEIKRLYPSLTLGIQILAGASQAALASALVSGADFIRAEGFVFGHMANSGLFDSCAGKLLRYRKSIGADHIPVFTDIKKKHGAHQITADVSIAQTAKEAEFFLSDGLIVTGTSTGEAADLLEVQQVRENSQLPLLIGSGITAKNLENYFPFIDGLIVGSSIKEQQQWFNNVDSKAASELVAVFNQLAKKHG